MNGVAHLGQTLNAKMKSLLWFLWLSVAISVAVWKAVGQCGWDVAIYRSAFHFVMLGQDPYAAATAVQIEAHRTGGIPVGVDPPYSYVYPPATLPLMRLLASLAGGHLTIAYWLLYALAVLAQIWFAMQFVDPYERPWFLFFAPIAPFFPGLLANGILMSGNIAYLLYAAVFLAALRGWRGKNWLPFYLAVIFASYFKAPLLSLTVIAPLSARKQWASTIATFAIGASIFAGQSLVWPTLFGHYLEAVNLQFKFNGDFGCSPAGLLSNLLFQLHLPFSSAGLVCYLAYGALVFLSLFYLSRYYLAGIFSTQQWAPVLIVGVSLLNPRLIEYDMAPQTLFLAMILWRSLRSKSKRIWLQRVFTIALVLMNAVALYSWTTRKALDGVLLVALFTTGCWRLLSLTKHPGSAATEPDFSLTNEGSIVLV